MLELLLLAATIGQPEVRMPPDFYHLCITEHPRDSRAFWQCAVDLDRQKRDQIGEEGFRRMRACNEALAILGPDDGDTITLELGGDQVKCTRYPPRPH